MENVSTLMVPVFFLCVLIRMMMLPIKFFWKVLLNSACGFLCLWLLNGIAGFTGLLFPINAVTVIVAGALGLPGIGILALVQFVL